MADTRIAEAVKAALASVESPGGGDLAGYGGLSEVIVTPSAVAFAISVAPGMEAAFGPARAAAQKAAEAIEQMRAREQEMRESDPAANVILPEATLKLLDRNILNFVEHRAQLRQLLGAGGARRQRAADRGRARAPSD